MAPVLLPSRWGDPALMVVVLDQEAGRMPDVTEASLSRVRYWLTAMGCIWQDEANGGISLPAEPQPPMPMPSLIAWAKVIMGYFPQVDARILARRRPHILAQAAARLRAESEDVPATLRRESRLGDIDIRRRHQPYANYFAVEEIDFTHQKFTPGHSAQMNRAVFVAGDAVTVLPYDRVRDRVLLVEQLRSGPLVRGDRNAWQLEAIAGRIDPGETPADAALREAIEEAQLQLDPTNLRAIADYYASPGTSTEKIYAYLALADLPDGIAGIHGLDSEDEDIRGHLISFDQLMDLVGTGEIGNALTILSALWLARERPGLRA